MFDTGYTRRSVLATTVKQLTHSHRYNVARRAILEWMFVSHNSLPVRFLTELWPEIIGIEARCRVDISHHFELPYGERAVLAAIVGFIRPRRIFEYGTFTGKTTTLLADCSPPNSIVHTIDLPAEEITHERWIAERIGREFVKKPQYQDRIILHRSDSAEFDFSGFSNQFDLVFIDGSHKYSDVLQDSMRAFEMLSPAGVIVWDDYHAAVPGVVLALNELGKRHQLVRIANTRLVVYRRQAFPDVPTRNTSPWNSI